MADYAILAKWKSIKGIFKKRIAGEYLLIGINRKEGIVVFQIFKHVKNDLFICGIVGGLSTPDPEEKEAYFDALRYDSSMDVIEDKIPVKVQGPKYIFTKPSKYMGKQFEIFSHSRLPSGYYMLKAKVKKGFEPAKEYAKGEAPMANLTATKQMRAFSSAQIKRITKK